MGEPARVHQTNAIDAAVQETLDICGGDAINALRVTLIATAFLEARIDELTAQVSTGFGRGRVLKARRHDDVV